MMTYAGIQMFMDKLNQLINCNHNPLINIPSIIHAMPQFQLLYDELGSMIQTLFIDQHQDLENLHDLKKRFISAAEEAEYNVDLFLSGVHIRNNGHFPTYEDFKRSLNLDDVLRAFSSVDVELIGMRIDGRLERTLTQSAPISLRSKRLLDEIFVGFDRDAQLIIKRLVEYRTKVDVVSIVGMGGIGKTTLATKVFNDDYVKYHFHVRVWVTVSQTYDKRAVLTQIIESIGAQLDLEKASDSQLYELVHKHLIHQRYLIVLDDIWHTETWDNLKLFVPHGNNGSRILVTSRITEVAKHVKSDGLVHQLGYLNKQESWELLCLKVFDSVECPEWAIKPGMQIVENCKGLPLAVVVIAGVLAKEAWSEKFWLEIAKKTSSYIVSDQNGCLETLALSYDHLPLHLRECFLYLGGFPEDHKLQVQRLIWLWVAEGFIQKDGNRSLEDIAEGYLMDLIDRNLVIVYRRRSDGRVKVCKVHDLVRELCLKKAKVEQFNILTGKPTFSSEFNIVKKPPKTPVRMFLDAGVNILGGPYQSAQNRRSMLCFYIGSLRDDVANHFHFFVLLRVLDLQNCIFSDFSKGMELLVHLRYLAIHSSDFPSSICNLWNLQTLIIYVRNQTPIVLPSNISDMVNLRHLWSYNPFGTNKNKRSFVLTSIEKPMNLQTISGVKLGDGVENFQKYFPYVKKLRYDASLDEEYDFKSFIYLEKLKLTGTLRSICRVTFPTTLKTLTLYECRLAWSDMSIIQLVPNLRVLKLSYNAFEGRRWDTYGQEFQQLKFLRLDSVDIKQWEAYSTSFPCLKQLEIIKCKDLEEIPLEIGDIPTLELIKVFNSAHSASDSVRRIQVEQRSLGNYDLNIDTYDDTEFPNNVNNKSRFWMANLPGI